MPSSKRLNTFTGLAPKSKDEVDFFEFERQSKQLLQDASIHNAKEKILGSLRGIPVKQVKACNTADEILEKLRGIYGNCMSAEDRYLTFSELKPTTKESASEFLCRLWGEMSRINEDNIFTETQAAVKIYHIFMKNCHHTLAMELRQKFGFPGEASPDLTELLQQVRRLEGSLPETKPKVQVNAATVQEPLTDTQLDQIAEKVASKLQAVRKPKICYRCGQGGHLARSCRNEPNPKKVAEERKKNGV
jgi:hypothetical protein